MNVIDKITGYLAPHTCLGCEKEGSVLCGSCIELFEDTPQPRCAGCRSLSDNFKVCTKCRKWLPLNSVYVSGNYEGVNEALIKELKFNYKRQASESISRIMTNVISEVDPDLVVCPIPTAPSRIRKRGFDHCALISKELAKNLNLKQIKFLKRHSNVRQLGSSRRDRFEHMKSEFEVVKVGDLKDRNIMLVDDVMTTGATLGAAAKALRSSGAKSVSAVIFAQKN